MVAGGLGVGASYSAKPNFTATVVILSPQPPQSAAASALASLGALSDFAGVSAGGGTRRSPDQYIALMQSATVSDRIIKKFDLRNHWAMKFQVDARRRLAATVAIAVGKKDGLIRIAATDPDPARAAEIANQYVEELRALTNTMAITEAQQRRAFFEQLLQQTRDKLAAAQSALETGGYTAGALNAEPRNAAEGYARIRAELTAAEVKLQVLRNGMAEGSAEVRNQRETVNALAGQLARMESQESAPKSTGDYVNRYREYKYQEALFNLFAHDYEAARVDESREGALIQVLDPATPPERKSSPTRLNWGMAGFALGLVFSAAAIGVRSRRSATKLDLAEL